ncbi:MAG: (deoxy)nucleoside triphosphate pyrophosphohydrolase [Loigolactobacillus coryniformis]|jgi:8-oxo-dGTP diphosphatase|uniref:(deoxy)nucleoside triphosphate pyrophosphohydrolase n=1 Tax=Loigolactobacillus coryniformis TaxID=1610 RepID=UPI00264985C1|nr:(deoxy)nucleoside triphosphate pyrophosphohydrolase [Loigolactobacillus coryniformis]MDN5953050.1 (deoxy)nucleoside triphosphate pyrophosphohydrolase [Loigolactobacillus coryniformis]
MVKEFNVVGAILIKDKQILSCQRGPGRALNGYWEFPGGKIEPGETARQALQRELEEELKIEVEVAANVFVQSTYEYEFGRVKLQTFLCRLITGTPMLTEHINVDWFKPTALAQLNFAPVDVATAEKLIQLGDQHEFF